MDQPRAEIDKDEVARLAYEGATTRDIAAMLDIAPKHLAAHHGKLLRKKRAERRQALRQAQFRMALDGNASMLTWLAKVELGQSDKPKPTTPGIIVSYEHRGLGGQATGPPCESDDDPE